MRFAFPPYGLPSDVGGFLYKKFDNSIEEVAYNITKELKASGYTLATLANDPTLPSFNLNYLDPSFACGSGLTERES